MKVGRRWVAYVGPFEFPWGQAASKRVRGNAKAIMDLGYDVVVGCGGAPSPEVYLEESELSGATLSWCGLGEVKSIGKSLKKLLSYLFFCGANTVGWLSSKTEKPEYVIVYGGLFAYGWHVLRWCRLNNVSVIVDLVEWYDPSQLKGGRFGPFYASSKLAMRFLYPRFDGAIVISSYLEKHYGGFYPTIIVPPVLGSSSSAIPSASVKGVSSGLNLIYAGTPGKKDLLAQIIFAVERVASIGKKIHLYVLGPNVEAVKNICGLMKLPDSVSIIGNVPQEGMERYYRLADFSVILRGSARFTRAGFPTKFVESLAFGTPVISNLTSDIGHYLRNGFNGYVVNSASVDDLFDVLCEAVDLSSARRGEMRESALLTASRFFRRVAFLSSLRVFS